MGRARERLERRRRLRFLVLALLLAAGLFAASPGHHGAEHADHADEGHACLACALTPVEPPTFEPPRIVLAHSGTAEPTLPADRVDAPRRRLPTPRGPPRSSF